METLRRYEKSTGLANDLARAVARLEAKLAGRGQQQEDVATSRHYQRFRLDSLSSEQADDLVKRFKAGTPKTMLADEYGISRSSVQRILRRQRSTG